MTKRAGITLRRATTRYVTLVTKRAGFTSRYVTLVTKRASITPRFVTLMTKRAG